MPHRISAQLERLNNFVERVGPYQWYGSLVEIGGIAAAGGGVALILTGNPTEGFVMGSSGSVVAVVAHNIRINTTEVDTDAFDEEEEHLRFIEEKSRRGELLTDDDTPIYLDGRTPIPWSLVEKDKGAVVAGNSYALPDARVYIEEREDPYAV